MPVDRAVQRIARAVAREAMASGALAVVLTGSHVRGDATAHSDIDLVAVLRRPPDEAEWRPLVRRGAHLVSLSWTTPAKLRADLRDPARFPTYVPGWREVVILHDPDGVARRLQVLAERWTWESVETLCDVWVAAHITSWAEEVHKLIAALEQGSTSNAAVQRSLLALHLAGMLAVYHRMLYSTENTLWDLVADRMGEPWTSAQARALGEDGESLDDSCRAALELYAIAANEARTLLDRRQLAVVDHAAGLAANAMRS